MKDLFGHEPETAPFVDIRNQRESVAEEKARLCLTLHTLCKQIPLSLSGASINRVREWRHTHKSALKILNRKESSRSELTSAINSLENFR